MATVILSHNYYPSITPLPPITPYRLHYSHRPNGTIQREDTQNAAIYCLYMLLASIFGYVVELSLSAQGIFVFNDWVWLSMAYGHGKYLALCIKKIFD